MVIRLLLRNRLCFILGLCLGLVLSQLMTGLSTIILPSHQDRSASLHLADRQGVFDSLSRSLHDRPEKPAGENSRIMKFEDVDVHRDDDAVAKELAKHVRVLVWVMTTPHNLHTKAIHVRNTWGKRANTLLFMSSQWNSTFPAIGLNVTEDRAHLTAKTMQAFRYVFQHHFDDADWFMKTDDDTYVIMENLRYMLSSYDTHDPIYFGHVFNDTTIPQVYASGGAGYVMSKEALRRLVMVGQTDETLCSKDGDLEDIKMGRCLMNIGVKLMSSLDGQGRSRFHCGFPGLFIQGNFPDWMRRVKANGAKHGIESISDYPITFHYISADHMYELEFCVYHMRPFGISFNSNATSLLKRLVQRQVNSY